jgi:transporter family-2 protein
MTLISILAGVAIALQSAMSGQFSSIIRSPSWTSLMIYFSSTIVMGTYLFLSKTEVPNIATLKLVPIHLWFMGAFLSVFALTLVYWQMPKIGISQVMVGVLIGQLLLSVIASHYGWFNLPIISFNLTRLVGIIFLIMGLFLINGSSN